MESSGLAVLQVVSVLGFRLPFYKTPTLLLSLGLSVRVLWYLILSRPDVIHASSPGAPRMTGLEPAAAPVESLRLTAQHRTRRVQRFVPRPVPTCHSNEHLGACAALRWLPRSVTRNHDAPKCCAISSISVDVQQGFGSPYPGHDVVLARHAHGRLASLCAGPMVFASILYAKLLAIPLVVSYHTHIPEYIPRCVFRPSGQTSAQTHFAALSYAR